MATGKLLRARLRQARRACFAGLGLPQWRGTVLGTLSRDGRSLKRSVMALLLWQWSTLTWLIWPTLHSNTLRVFVDRGFWTTAAAAAAALPVLLWSLLTAPDEIATLTVAKQDRTAYGSASEKADAASDTPREPCAPSRERVLGKKLAAAIADGRIRVVYQPIFAADRSIQATEALARWQDDELGEISPAEFIPIAEGTGLISQISTLVMRKACFQMKQWQSLGFPMRRIAVNVSVAQICRGDFFACVLRILHETKLAPQFLELEVTESAFARDFRVVQQTLQALRRLGVRISIDDFGVGYSSFSRLRELDCDVLKIDRAFVQSASDTQNGRAVVQAIIEMAHTLNLSVIAEGVETQAQLELLDRMGCDEIQGFLLARPQSADAVSSLFRATASKAKEGELRVQLRPVTV